MIPLETPTGRASGEHCTTANRDLFVDSFYHPVHISMHRVFGKEIFIYFEGRLPGQPPRQHCQLTARGFQFPSNWAALKVEDMVHPSIEGCSWNTEITCIQLAIPLKCSFANVQQPHATFDNPACLICQYAN